MCSGVCEAVEGWKRGHSSSICLLSEGWGSWMEGGGKGVEVGSGGVRKQRWWGEILTSVRQREGERERGKEGMKKVWVSGCWSYCGGRTRRTGNQSAETIQSTFPLPTPGQEISPRVCAELPKSTTFGFSNVWRGNRPRQWADISSVVYHLFDEDTNRGSDRRCHLGCHTSLLTQLLPPEQTSEFVDQWTTKWNRMKRVF